MKYSYNWLKDLVDLTNLPPQKLAEIIEAHSFEVEDITKVEHFGLSDAVLNIETGKTNRVDVLGHLGLAAEISAVTGRAMKKRLFKQNEPKGQGQPAFKLRVDSKLCRKYAAWQFTGVKIVPSPHWLQSRLLACGLKPINNVVDIANYVMLLTGQPLHVFDAAKLKGGVLQVRRAKPKEMIRTLDGETVMLDAQDAVIADKLEAVAIAGIKGGESTGVGSNTRTIVVEAANFHPLQIRRTSWRLGLRTDAAHRFEKNLPLELVETSLREVAGLLQEVAGATPGALAVVNFSRSRPKYITLAHALVTDLLGYECSWQTVSKILRRLGLAFKSGGSGKYLVHIPFSRPDLNLPEDLVEEIGRINGYEKIPEQSPPLRTVSAKDRALSLSDKLRRLLSGMGFTEVYNYSFYSRQVVAERGLDPKSHFRLSNPLSLDQELARVSLLPNLLKTARFNERFQKEFLLFEFGNVYLPIRTSKFYDHQRLALCYASSEGAKEVFLRLKGQLTALFEYFHIAHQYRTSSEDSAAGLGISDASGKNLGVLESGVLDKISYAAVELDFDRFRSALSQSVKFQKVAALPPVILDVAIIVPVNTRWDEIERIVRKDGLVGSVKLFDVYKGSQIPAGKKSLAFELTFQDSKRTLTDGEAKVHIDAIISNLQNKLKAVIR